MYHGLLPEDGRKPGGVEVFVDRVATALTARGHDVTVLSYTSGKYPRPYAVQTMRPAAATRSKFVKKYVASWSFNGRRLSRFDVFHFHGDDWFYLRRGVPTVRTFYGSALLEALTATSWKRRADQALVFLLELLAAQLATARYGIGTDSRSIYRADGVLRCGIQLPSEPASPAARPTIVFIGTWDGRKRGALLHRIFQTEIRPILPDARLVMISDRCEAGDGVEWVRHPSDADLRAILRTAWVFCLPSTYEGLGLPYLEAMAWGVPVVATPNVGAIDLLAPQRSGLLAEDDDLGSALLSVLSSQEVRDRLAEAGRERAADFGWERICVEYEQAYARAIQRWEAVPGHAL